jgi:hypothetical protein
MFEEASPLQHVRAGKSRQVAQALRQKALEPQVKHCYLLDIDVTVLVEYPDYKGPHHKGPEGAIYCENIVPCYQADRRCRYSGISPLFPDPFLPREPNPSEGEAGEDSWETTPLSPED